jgi:hypothetical protein
MNLQELEAKLILVGESGVSEVKFDFAQFLNINLHKSYPYVLWDINNSIKQKNRRDNTYTLELDVFIIGKYPEKIYDKLRVWDELEAYLVSYLAVVESDSYITIENITIRTDYYDTGLLSVDGEYGVKNRLTLKIWC